MAESRLRWFLCGVVAGAVGLPLVYVYAGSVSVPNRFVNGDIADADDVNANFDALAAGINDNASRMGDLGDLTTTTKTSLVAAINEVRTTPVERPVTLAYPDTVPQGNQAAGWVIEYDLLPGAVGSTKTFDVYWRDDNAVNAGRWILRFATAGGDAGSWELGDCGAAKGPDWPFFRKTLSYIKQSGLVEIRIDNAPPTGGCQQAQLSRVVLVLR